MSIDGNKINIMDSIHNENDTKMKKMDNKLNDTPLKISFLDLFRYSKVTEKIMIIFGIIGSIGQGLAIPLMIRIMRDLINLFIGLVVSGRIRQAAGVDDDDETPIETLYIKIAMNLFDFVANGLDTSGFQVPSGMTPEEMMALMIKLYKSRKEYWNEFSEYMLYLGLIGIFSFIFSYLMDAFFTISAMRQVNRIRSYAFESITKQDISWHEKTNPGELASRIINDTVIIENGIGFKLGSFIQNVVTFIACFILAYIACWKLSLFMSIIIPLIIIIVVCMSKVLRKFTKKAQDAFAELGGIAQEAFSQIRTIVSFGTEQKEIDRYNNKLLPTRKYGIIKGHTTGISLGLINGIIYASYSIAFIYGTRLIQDKEILYGEVLNVFMGIMMGSMMISFVGEDLSAFSEATAAASSIFNIIERKPQINLENGSTPDKPIEGHIEFQEVRFNYPSRLDVEVLKGISFKCLPGQTVAIVGASGSGKTTLIQLLERFYNKKSGRILIDGKDIEDYNVKWLRSQIGLVSQEPSLFDVSVAKNISINFPNATQEQIEEAAKLANAHDFILQLSNGYETNPGERGLQMSGGQKQRICIARALINNPKILLLDEATSALDNKSEKVVQEALDSAISKRTTIVIAHRLSTIKNADLIIVMENGIIIESGTHEELMEKGQHYYDLVKNQEIKIKEEENDSEEEENESNEANKNIEQKEKNEENNDKKIEDTQETELVGKIHSTFLSINKTTSNINDTSKDEESSKVYYLKDMPWKRFLNYNKPNWLHNFLGIIGAIFNGAIPPAFAYVVASALNTFTYQGDALLDRGKKWGIIFIILGVVTFFSYYFNISGFIISGEYLSYNLRKKMYNSMIHQEVGFFDTNDIGGDLKNLDGKDSNNTMTSTGTLMAKLTTEANLVHGLNSCIGQIFQQMVTIIGGFGIAFINGWKLTLVLLITVPFLLFGSAFKMNSMKYRNKRNQTIYEHSSKIATEAIANIKTVYALNLSEYFTKYYNEKLNEPLKYLERKAYISAIGTGFSNGISFFAYILGYWVGSIFIDHHEMQFDEVFKVLMAIILMAMAVGQSSSIVSESQKAIEGFMHVIEIIDRIPIIDSRDPKGITSNPENFKGDLELDSIRFRYPSRPKVTVLRLGNKKVEIPAGKMCAFVGASGSGKSTMIGLIPRWYDANHGSVKVDGVVNKDYNIKWLREQIGIVNQEPCLFNISIKENIKYGKQNATDEEVYEAAKKANIHDFIMSLPGKYDTLVGGMGTSQMSGGQKQRIAIARAMIRNPKILLLDEATSALDAESELIVQKALEDASEGRTTITIAHRLSTIKDADLICVFNEGRIKEMGNHEELMEMKGEYYNMVIAGDRNIGEGNTNTKNNTKI